MPKYDNPVIANQFAIPSLTDNNSGTADGTLQDMPAVQATPTGMVASERTAIVNNFEELNVKLQAVLVALRNSNLIVS